jgi:hypothetical protein
MSERKLSIIKQCQQTECQTEQKSDGTAFSKKKQNQLPHHTNQKKATFFLRVKEFHGIVLIKNGAL